MEATARANMNIALIKYWGKRDEKLLLPMNSSISITLDLFYTTTTVQFCNCLKADVLIFNQQLATNYETMKVSRFLDHVRKLAGIVDMYAIVTTINKLPTSAGFASSASGFAALAAAATKALNLKLEDQELSRLARLGSGSACRSVYGGFVEWQKGNLADGSDSYAQPILSEGDWKLSILSVSVATSENKISNREGMKQTVESSPLYSGWLKTVEKDIQIAKEAINNRDFHMFGTVVEANAMNMHAMMLGVNPPLMYWESGTVEVIREIQNMREQGIPVYLTVDAGANIKVLSLLQDEFIVREKLLTLPAVRTVSICHPGAGISYLRAKKKKYA